MSAWHDTTPSAVANSWDPAGTSGSGNDFNGGFSKANVSKHGSGNGDGQLNGGCHVCSAEDHFTCDCPNKKATSGVCYNCGDTGHNRKDCSNPRVEREFNGTCKICGQYGHRARNCPEKPAEVCRMCKEEGHVASDCTVNRMTANYKELRIETLSDDEAWKMLEAADKDKDVDDIKKVNGFEPCC
ncbi:hypothetical protein M433DRAFT_153936 [Acidomyces richmondensis BFW]|nr:hypothetical protein M433DRAFT_153936 [Acidomyces richmondensis BFW]